ncbi:hypothetical protein BJ508DRAFT_416037 [Ascobolus immersus RN42]|uniref:Uncharacterized protein n=1 Tax=Ascobolus immersus RN42 TaxID=1160509 RepID=A0A3N4IC20_ASCIM|nr:hypothetical protein BJ508DRAFT_416037 [Ascobolus immersus RN42]
MSITKGTRKLLAQNFCEVGANLLDDKDFRALLNARSDGPVKKTLEGVLFDETLRVATNKGNGHAERMLMGISAGTSVTLWSLFKEHMRGGSNCRKCKCDERFQVYRSATPGADIASRAGNKMEVRMLEEKRAPLRIEGVCHAAVALSTNKEFLALLDGPVDAWPAAVAGPIVEKEMETFEKDRSLSGPLGNLLPKASNYFDQLCKHLSVSNGHPLAKPLCESCSNIDSIPNFRTSLAQLQNSIAARERREYDQRVRDHKEKIRIEEEEGKARRQRCACHIVREMSKSDAFLNILRNSKSGNWVDEAGAIVKTLAIHFLRKPTSPSNEQQIDKAIAGKKDKRPEWEKKDLEDDQFYNYEDYESQGLGLGHFLGEFVLFHLFGAFRDNRLPCEECIENESVKDLMKLLDDKLATTAIDLHYQRPLDSDEDSTLEFMRDAILTDALTYGHFPSSLEELLDSTDGEENSMSASEWIELVGTEMKDTLESISIDDPRSGTCYDDMVINSLWDIRVDTDLFLRDVAPLFKSEWEEKIIAKLDEKAKLCERKTDLKRKRSESVSVEPIGSSKKLKARNWDELCAAA